MSSTAQSRERRGFLSSASRFAGDTPTALPVNNLKRTKTDKLSIRSRQREVQTSRSRSSSRQSNEDEKQNNESKEFIERSNTPQSKDYYGTLNNQNLRNGHTMEHSSIDRGRLRTLSSRSTPSSIRRTEPRKATSKSRGSALPSSSRRIIHQSGSIDNVEIAEEDELWGDIAALTSKLARMQREGASVETVRKAASEMVAARIKKNEGLRLQESGSKTKEFDMSNRKSTEWSANKTKFVSSQPDYSSSKKSYNTTTSQKNTSRKTLNPSALQTISFIDVDDVVDNNKDKPLDFADESLFTDGDDEEEEDAESEESNAGDKGMQAAVAELTRMEVEKQMKMMFQSGELGSLRVSKNSETPNLKSLPSSAEIGSKSPFPFSPVPLQVGATLTADFGEFNHQNQFDAQTTSDSSSFNQIDDDESSGLSSENDDEEADHASKVAAEKAMVLAIPAASSLSEGQKRMLAMTLGIDRAKIRSPSKTAQSFDRNHSPQNDTRYSNHEFKRNRRAVITSPQSVDDETDDEPETTLSPSAKRKHERSTQLVASQPVKSVKVEKITLSLPPSSSSLSSSSPSLKSVAFSVSPLKSAPLPLPDPPPLPPAAKTPPPDSFIDDTKLLKEEVKTLRALLERVAGQLEEQKERQNIPEMKMPLKVTEAVGQNVPIENIKATPRSPIPPHLNNENISSSSVISSSEKKHSSAALTSSFSLSSPSSKTSSLSPPPSSLLNTAPPPKSCAPSLPDVYGPIYSVIADFFGDPADSQINLSIGDVLVCPNDEEHRPIEALSNGWWFAYKLIPSTGHLSNLQAPPQLDKHTDKFSLSTVKGYVPFAYLNSTGEMFSRASVIKSSSSMASEVANAGLKVSLPPQLSSPAVSSPHVHGPLKESRLTAHKAAAARARIQLSLPFSTRDDNNTSITNLTTGKLREQLSIDESHPSFTSPTSPDINPMWNAKSGVQRGSLFTSQPSVLQNIERSHFTTTSNLKHSTSSTLIQKSSSDYSDWNSLKAAYEQLKLSAKKLDVTSEFAKSFPSTNSHNVTSRLPSSTLPTATSHPLELNRDLGFGALSSALVTLMKPTSSSTSIRQNIQQTHTQNSNEKTFSSSKLSTSESQENDEFISKGRITEPDHDAALLGSIASSFRASSMHPGNNLSSILSIEKKVDVDEKQTSKLSKPPPLRLSSPSILSIPPPQVAFSPPILENEPPFHPSLSVKGRETRLTDVSRSEQDNKDAHSENVLSMDVMRSYSLSLSLPPHSMSSLSKKPFLELSSNPAPALDVPGSRRGEGRLKPRRKDVNAPAVGTSDASFGIESDVMLSSSQDLTVVPESKSLVTLRNDSDDHLISMMNLSSFSHIKEKNFSPKLQDRNGDNTRITSPVSPFYAPPTHSDELVNLEENYEQQQVNPPDSSKMTNNNVISPLKLGGPLPGSVVLKGMPFSEVIPQKIQSSRSTPPNLAAIATNTLKSAIRAASTSSPSKIHPSSEERNIFHDKQLSLTSPQMLENIARAKEMKQIRRMRQSDSAVLSSSLHPLQQTSSFKRARVPIGLIDDEQEEKLNEPHFKEGEEDGIDFGDDETEDYMESVDLEEEIKLRKTDLGDTEDYHSGQPMKGFEKEDNYSSRVSRESSKKKTTHSINSLTPLETKSEEWDSSPSNKIKGPSEQQQQLENASPGESRLGTVATWLGLKSQTRQRGDGNDAITDDGERPSDTISKDAGHSSRTTSPLVQVTSPTTQKLIVAVPRENSSVAAGVGLITPIGQEGLGRSSASKIPSSVLHVSSLLPKFVTTKEGLINLAPPQQQLAVRGEDEVSNLSKNPAVIDKRPVILTSSLPYTQSNGFQPSMVKTSERDEYFGSVPGSDSSPLVYSASSASQRPESIRVTSGAPPHLRGLRASASLTVNSSGSIKRVRTFS